MSAAFSYPPVSPSLVVNDGVAALEFYKKAFGAEERYRLIDPETGKIGHAEITIKGVLMMLGEEYADYYIATKRSEWSTHQNMVSDWEREQYLAAF